MIVIFIKTALKYNPEMYGGFGVSGADIKHKWEIWDQIEAMHQGWA